MLTILLLYLCIGVVVGFLAGLLGIGGGIIIVPTMVFSLNWQGVPHELVMHLALGTSLASILFTSVSSFRAHHKRGAVHWDMVRRIVLGILTGTFLGSVIAARMGTDLLKGFLVIFLYGVAVQLLMNREPKASRAVPGHVGMFGVGNGIGVISAMVGIGGGTLSVPFMVWCNLSLRHAIGTSAAIVFPIALAGAIGYIFNGLGNVNLPEYSLGYVYLPGMLGVACTSMLTAPLGVRLAHRLPMNNLKKVFAILLLVVATRMLIGSIQNLMG